MPCAKSREASRNRTDDLLRLQLVKEQMAGSSRHDWSDRRRYQHEDPNATLRQVVVG